MEMIVVIYLFMYTMSYFILYKLTKIAYLEVEILIKESLEKATLVLKQTPLEEVSTDCVHLSEVSIRQVARKILKDSRSSTLTQISISNIWLCPIVFVAYILDDANFEKSFNAEFKHTILEKFGKALNAKSDLLDLTQMLDMAILNIAKKESENGNQHPHD